MANNILHHQENDGFLQLGPKAEIFLAVITAILLGLTVLHSPFMAFVALGIIAVVALFARLPIYAGMMLIFFFPFSRVEQMSLNLLAVPGTKPILLLGAFVTVIAFLNFNRSVRMSNLQRQFATVLLVLFVINTLRALPEVAYISEVKGENLSTFGYLLSYLIKPFVYFIPFLVIAKFVYQRKHLDILATTITLAMLAFSGYFLFHYIFNVPDKGSIEAAWVYVADILHLHKNAAAAFYVVAFPLVLGRYFAKKDLLGLVTLLLSSVSVAFMYSRTAYFTILVSTVVFCVISRRTRYLPLIGMLGIVFIFSLSSTVLERASKGLGEDGDLNLVTAGRLERLWKPILGEYAETPALFIVGQGKYSIMQTKVFKDETTLPSDHPHNMYIESIIDSGFLGFFALTTIYLIILLRVWKSIRGIRDKELQDYQCAALAAILSYLMAGMTQGSLLPNLENSFTFTAVAFALAILRYSQENTDDGQQSEMLAGENGA